MSTNTRWQRKKEARPSEILDAALNLFVEKGFRATTMEDIARAAGVTKGTPYLYFANKEDIFKAVVRETQVAHISDLESQANSHSGTTAELLTKLCESWWNEIGATKLSGLCKLMMAEAANFPELAAFYYDEVIRPARTMTAAVIEKGIASGELRPVALDSAVDTLIAPLLNTIIWKYSFGSVPNTPSSMDEPQRYLNDALAIILRGLAARPI
jgi:AcrR family transcriptional regulator